MGNHRHREDSGCCHARARRNAHLIGICAAALLATPVHAEVQFLTGASGAAGNATYLYAGAVAPLSGDLGNGILGRVWLDRLGYRFDSAGKQVDATTVSGSGSIGWHRTVDGNSLGLFVTLADQETGFSPDQPANGNRGNHWFGQAAVELGHDDGSWRSSLDANVTPAVQGYWSRLAVLRRFDGFSAGPEAMFHGNRDYHAIQAGLAVAGLHVGTDAEVGFTLGYENTNSVGGGYGGINFTKLFR